MKHTSDALIYTESWLLNRNTSSFETSMLCLREFNPTLGYKEIFNKFHRLEILQAPLSDHDAKIKISNKNLIYKPSISWIIGKAKIQLFARMK